MKKLTLVLFTTLLLLTTAGYAENEALVAEVAEAKRQLKELQDEKSTLKEQEAYDEEEIAKARLELDDLEAKIEEIKATMKVAE